MKEAYLQIYRPALSITLCKPFQLNDIVQNRYLSQTIKHSNYVSTRLANNTGCLTFHQVPSNFGFCST